MFNARPQRLQNGSLIDWLNSPSELKFTFVSAGLEPQRGQVSGKRIEAAVTRTCPFGRRMTYGSTATLRSGLMLRISFSTQTFSLRTFPLQSDGGPYISATTDSCAVSDQFQLALNRQCTHRRRKRIGQLSRVCFSQRSKIASSLATVTRKSGAKLAMHLAPKQ
jgi:hypothetical protein